MQKNVNKPPIKATVDTEKPACPVLVLMHLMPKITITRGNLITSQVQDVHTTAPSYSKKK